MKDIRIGYHRLSDDSVTSVVIPLGEAMAFITELYNDDDVCCVWARDVKTDAILF